MYIYLIERGRSIIWEKGNRRGKGEKQTFNQFFFISCARELSGSQRSRLITEELLGQRLGSSTHLPDPSLVVRLGLLQRLVSQLSSYYVILRDTSCTEARLQHPPARSQFGGSVGTLTEVSFSAEQLLRYSRDTSFTASSLQHSPARSQSGRPVGTLTEVSFSLLLVIWVLSQLSTYYVINRGTPGKQARLFLIG